MLTTFNAVIFMTTNNILAKADWPYKIRQGPKGTQVEHWVDSHYGNVYTTMHITAEIQYYL